MTEEKKTVHAGGIGKRAWTSNFSGGIGKRGWNNAFSGNSTS
jgi:hypothetical protein